MSDPAAKDSESGAAPPPPEEPRPGPELWAPRLSAAIALLLALAYMFLGGAGPGDFCVDDAWIHLSYAKSLRLGDGASYNPGDWQTGFSSPLWMLLLAAWPTEGDTVLSVKLLGALLHAGEAGLASLLALEIARARASLARPIPLFSIALLAGVLVATAPTLLQSAGSGMEIGLCSCLLLAAVYTSLREQWLLTGVAGALAVLARPEALFFLATFAAILAVGRRQRAAVAAGLGAALGLGAWVIYCLALTGWPWPNTGYVKAGSGSLAGGLDYLAAQVFPWQPWIVGFGAGLALIAAALYTDLTGEGVLEGSTGSPSDDAPARHATPRARHVELVALLVAWIVATLAIAVSRPLDPAISFYQSRYFAIFAAVPPVLIAMGIARTNRLLCLALTLPIAVFTGLQINELHTLQRAQERGVSLLHGDPARALASELPPDAVVAVEGAGSARYKTPRTMTIVDIIGLNDAEIAHADGDAAKACVLLRREPDYFVLPDHIAASLAKVFALRPMAEFVDPKWAQIEEPREVHVFLFAVEGVNPRWRARCTTGE
ncbi:hypothetical protein G6O69_21980 [Pseudenhygromyxa sp. WMMC2535]|uniref:hypothetical protein n=1 Tax=Pseudenhygromyxa sp. WMMC2535 TaxID=2712867 RepID=UPI001557B020|nr:hypothetical protein [Pseudenhygromyxa sp. WMMC2535]NVB40526.1 hypothetical protein [Pseudenhygromyxa sp. WMMC2535]